MAVVTWFVGWMSFCAGVCGSMLAARVKGRLTVASQVVKYSVDGSTDASFVVDPGEWGGWQDAGVVPGDVVDAVRDAVDPAVQAAKVVLDKITEIHPGSVEVKFGIMVSGGANWAVAKAAAEGSFEVTLTWNQGTESTGAE